MKRMIAVLLLLPFTVAADEVYDKDIGQCLGLTSMVTSNNPGLFPDAEKALKMAVEQLLANGSTVNADYSERQSLAYIERLKAFWPEVSRGVESPEFEAAVKEGVNSCKAIGIELSAPRGKR